MFTTMEENQFQAFVLAKKISGLLIELGLLKPEGKNSSTIRDFNFDGINYIFNLGAGEVSVSKSNEGDYYDISLDPDLPSNSDSVNPGRDYPDWVVYRLSHLYDFLKA